MKKKKNKSKEIGLKKLIIIMNCQNNLNKI